MCTNFESSIYQLCENSVNFLNLICKRGIECPQQRTVRIIVRRKLNHNAGGVFRIIPSIHYTFNNE